MSVGRSLTIDTDPRRRAIAFLSAFIDAPQGADIEFRTGVMESGEPAVVISIDGALSGFTAAEARIVADVAESTMRAFPRETGSLADLILSLRMCADKSDKPAKARLL